jgi:hypothetical protein
MENVTSFRLFVAPSPIPQSMIAVKIRGGGARIVPRTDADYAAFVAVLRNGKTWYEHDTRTISTSREPLPAESNATAGGAITTFELSWSDALTQGVIVLTVNVGRANFVRRLEVNDAARFAAIATTLQSGQTFLRRTEVRPFGPAEAITTAKTDVEVP